MKTPPATKFPDGPAKPMKQSPGQAGVSPSGRGMQFHSGPGSQTSMNPKKNQTKTMRYV